jgi:transposase-like protein
MIRMSRKAKKGPDCRPECKESEIIGALPKACSDETAAVEFFELQRWGNTPCCVHCGSVQVYKRTDRNGTRNKRFLWRCRDCKLQYTVRIGTVYEESRLPMKHWAYAFWRAATSKKGVAALEIKRHCQITYKAALFLMNRIRFAMAPDTNAPKLMGTVELDEVYIGGKPRPHTGYHKRGAGTKKQPVFVAVERNGQIRRRIMTTVNGTTLKAAVRELVDNSAKLMTDENLGYNGLAPEFVSHEKVNHGTKEYARGDVHTNTAESSNALIKRGLVGIYHSVSKEYLHRYLWQWDFCWNHRESNDGDRTVAAIKSAEGKRLMYKEPTDNSQH